MNRDAPTRTRFVVLGVLCLLSGILYLDRICISAALDSIQRDVGLTNKQASYVLMAFTLAYGLFEVPTGRWGDLLGARRVLTRISVWWSVFTALSGACWNLGSLVAVRFLFGAGEAGAFPNVARVLSRWFPDHERGRAQGVLLAASQVGGAVAPFLAAVLILNIGWRWTFVVFGSVGIVWAAGFWLWFRDDPAKHPAVNAAEVAHIGVRATALAPPAIPWRSVLRSRSVLWLGLIMTCASFNSYIYFSWYPKYLGAARGIGPKEAGLMASMVLAFAAVGTLSGGFVLDRLALGASTRRTRTFGFCALTLAAAMLGVALVMERPWLAALFAALSCFAAQSVQTLWWTCAIGTSGRHVGALFGLMNSMGVVGAMSSQFLVGASADWLGAKGLTGRAQWDPMFYVDIGVLMLAALLWASFRLVPVEPPEASKADS
jgi:MFS family permease